MGDEEKVPPPATPPTATTTSLGTHDNEKQTQVDTTTATGTGTVEKKKKWWSKKQPPTENGENGTEGGEKKVETPPTLEFPPVGLLTLLRYSTPFEIFIDIIGIICAIAAGAAQPLMTIMFGNLSAAFVDFGKALAMQAEQGNTPEVLQLIDDALQSFKQKASEGAMYLTILGVGFIITTYIYMYVWTYTGEVNAKRIRERYLQAILRQDIAFFDKVGAGEVATRIQSDTHLVQQGISEKVPMSASFVGAFAGGFIIAYVRSWKLALALTSILPCIMLAGGTMGALVGLRKVEQLKHIASGGSIAEEVISTIRTSHAFGIQKTLAEVYDRYATLAQNMEASIALIMGIGLSSMFFVIYAAYGLAFYFGTTLIINREVDIGVVLNCFLAIMIGSFSLAMLAPELQAINTARGAAAKLFDTIERVPPIDNADPGGLQPPRESVQGRIEFKNVKFNYPSRPDVPILHDLTLSFPAGQTVALVGASGSGKSTVVALVERFYDPLQGQILLDGVNLKDLNLKWLRSQIGLVSQEPILFATTIRKNVEYGMIGTPLEHAEDAVKFAAVQEACRKSNAAGFIEKLPEGYNTMVGERGFLLSGGQKQRIAIARAIVSDPKILLLDEATSALDTQSEGIVQDALDKAAAGRTTIVIAHRLSTIKDANLICVMGEGRILETGTHAQLLSDIEGPYSRLVQAQRLRESTGEEKAGRDIGTGTATPVDAETAIQREKIAVEEATLKGISRADTSRSLASEIMHERNKEKEEKEKLEAQERSMFYFMKRLYKYDPSLWKFYLPGTIGAVGSGMVYPAFGLAFGPAMAGFQTDDNAALRRHGDRSALYFFLIAIAAGIAGALQNGYFARASADLIGLLRRLYFRAMLRQDIAWFDDDRRSTGALTSSLSDDPQKINGIAGVTLGGIIQAICTLLGGSIIGLAYGWKLALVAIACIPFTIGGGYVRLRIVTLKDKVNKEAHEESAQIACEAAASIRTVASLTKEQDFLDQYSKSLEGPLRNSNRSSLHGLFYYSLSQGAVFWTVALTFWYGSRLVAAYEYDIKDFFIILMSVTFGAQQAGNIFAFVPDISDSKMGATAIIKLLDTVPEIDSESTEGKVPQKADVRGKITFSDVHFRYPTRPAVRVLRGFNLEVQPGTHVALVGASGCGKSTIVQLIERFYDPVTGAVLLDDQPINELNIQEYRKHVALVSQEPTLYAGTVKFNILLGATKPRDEVTQEEIENACRQANILDFIQSLPDGFDTEVGGKGSQLSGGQKQRIAIARALLRNPAVLLLDEATSALDSNSERVVQDALDSAAKGRTTISIAHRLSTIQQCDKIHFVHEGRIVESGTHEELIQSRGRYAEYVLLQDLSGM